MSANGRPKLEAPIDAEEAWDDAKALFAWPPQPADEALLRRARDVERRLRLSCRDRMVVAAAPLHDCALLLTGDLAVRSPFSLAIERDRSAYAPPAAARLHRPRGRPRKSAQA